MDPKADAAQFEAERAKFAATYAAMTDYELLNLKEGIATLKPEAQAALEFEIARRDFSEWSSELPLPQRHKGVRGWLRFLILLLCLYPVSSICYLLEELAFAKVFRAAPGISIFGILLEVACDLALAWFGLTAAIKLWRVKPSAVQYTKRFLAAVGAYGLFAILVYLALASIIRSDSLEFVLIDSFRALANVPSAIIGYFYVRHSKRVAATYGSAGRA